MPLSKATHGSPRPLMTYLLHTLTGSISDREAYVETGVVVLRMLHVSN